MISQLKRFYRRNYCISSKATLLNLFDDNVDLRRCVVLEERAPLAGIRTIYLWMELSDCCRLTVEEANLKAKKNRLIVDKKFLAEQFANLFAELEHTGASLGNFSAKVMDGVTYSLCWGDRSKSVALYINNPQIGSKPHQEFISRIKSFVKSEASPP